jgi:hypothetical protein
MYEDGVRVQPKRRVEIEETAYLLRKAFGFPGKTYFPLMKILEHELQNMVEGFYYDIREDGSLEGSARALAYPDKACILIEASVYDGACRGIGKDRMTITHETGHVILHPGIPLARRYEARPIKIYENSEWQSDVFAGELLAPIRFLHGMNASDIVQTYQISLSAAEAQLRALKKTEAAKKLTRI